MLAFSNSFGLKSIFQKLRFRDGLEWTVGLTIEKTLATLSNSSGVHAGAQFQ